MNYFGKILSDKISQKEIYGFLKKSMQKINLDRPFRGPSNFKEGDFEYTDKGEGDINQFFRKRKIFYKGKEVYKLIYHGGTPKISNN